MSKNIVILGQAGTNETYIPFSLDDGGVLYTQASPNANAGIIQGYNNTLEGGINISAVEIAEGSNALLTSSYLYATDQDGNLVNLTATVSTESTALDVNVVSGGGGGGGALQATLADESVVVVEAVAGTTAGTYALATSDINNLYYTDATPGLTGALLVYSVNSGGGGGGGALEATSTAGTVVAVEAVDGTIAGKYSLATTDIKQTYTNQTVGTTTKGYINSYSKLVGNSSATVEQIASMDTSGRLNINARISDTAGGGLGSTSVGGIKALNIVDLNNKYTGTGADALLNVSVGNAVGAPANMRTSSTVDTQSTTYYQNTITGKELGEGVWKYSLDTVDTNNKYYGATAPTENTGALLTYNLNGGGGGGALQATLADESVVEVEAVAGTATGTYALATSDVNNLYYGTTAPTENTGALLTYQVNSTASSPEGTLGNIHTGTLAPGASSTGLNINNLYGNESVLSYQDSTTGATLYVSIWGSLDDTNWFYLGVMAPTTLVRTSLRLSVAVLKLAGVKYIRITSEETATTLTGITATLVSG